MKKSKLKVFTCNFFNVKKYNLNSVLVERLIKSQDFRINKEGGGRVESRELLTENMSINLPREILVKHCLVTYFGSQFLHNFLGFVS